MDEQIQARQAIECYLPMEARMGATWLGMIPVNVLIGEGGGGLSTFLSPSRAMEGRLTTHETIGPSRDHEDKLKQHSSEIPVQRALIGMSTSHIPLRLALHIPQYGLGYGRSGTRAYINLPSATRR